MIRHIAKIVTKAALKLALLEDPILETNGLVWLHKDAKLTIAVGQKPKTLRLLNVETVEWQLENNCLVVTGKVLADSRQVDFSLVQREV